MAMKQRGIHDDCDNYNAHISPNDCWSQPDMYTDEEEPDPTYNYRRPDGIPFNFLDVGYYQ